MPSDEIICRMDKDGLNVEMNAQPSGYYTEEMRARALARIAAKREIEDTEATYRAYLGVCYRALLRRIAALDQQKLADSDRRGATKRECFGKRRPH